MEQQIGPKSPPIHGAATDPAFVPGLIPARPAAPVDEAPSPVDDKAAEEVTDRIPAEPAPEPEAEAPKATTPDTPVPEPDPVPSLADPGAGTGESDAGPDFEAADRRGAIVANRAGLVFRLDDQEAEFGWDEIGAVEFDASKYGRRLSVIVHLTNRHRYETDVTARSKDLLAEWTTQLDEVLDAYFEE
ncbi:hypothetical protein AB0436_05680 [Streptomyces sp. NPDC051322]|uniref:hypothetical protein n=1 Tax=Streptomyces sp. NPDC051322 TaxID=3154645 RepID=UPI00344D97DB